MGMTYPIPINSKGIFTLLPPFDTTLTPLAIYTCTSVSRLSKCIKDGEDPFEQYYAPYGLAQEEFDAAVLNDECIVTLQSSSGNVAHVPNSYISALPEIGGVPYTVMVLTVELGLVPGYLDLEHIRLKVIEVVRDTGGFEAEVGLVNASEEMLISQAQHDSVENGRLERMTEVSTDYAKYVRERTLRIQAEAKITELEKYIQANPRP